MTKPILYVGPYAILPFGTSLAYSPASTPIEFYEASQRTVTFPSIDKANKVLCFSPEKSFAGPVKYFFGNTDEFTEDEYAIVRMTHDRTQRDEIEHFLSRLRATFPSFLPTFGSVPIVFGAILLNGFGH